MQALRTWFDVSHYKTKLEQDHARTIYRMLVILAVLYTVFFTAIKTVRGNTNLQEVLAGSPKYIFFMFFFYGVLILGLVNIKRGRLVAGALAAPIMWYIIAVLDTLLLAHLNTPIAGLELGLLILISGFALRGWGILVSYIVALITLAVGMQMLAQDQVMSTSLVWSRATTLTLELSGMSFLVYLFLRDNLKNMQEGFNQAQEELRFARLTAAITGRISHRTSLREVLNNTVEQICEAYPDIYYAQIFLLNPDKQQARLAASSGNLGKLLMGRQVSLTINSNNPIYESVATGKAQFITRNSTFLLNKDSTFLPDTQTALMLPLKINDASIGVLDLQSKHPQLFTAENLPVFQSLATNIAIAIDNVQLVEETEKRLKENQQLVEQTQSAVQQVERLNQQLTRSSWDEYLTNKSDLVGLQVDLQTQKNHPLGVWTPTLQFAASQNQVVSQNLEDDGQVVAIPLRVRGHVVGAMEFELAANGQLAAEDLRLLEEVSEQLGLAAESNRLIETTQRLAQRETLVSHVATRIQASTTIEKTLTEAVYSLQEVLHASRVSIRLGEPPAPVSKETSA